MKWCIDIQTRIDEQVTVCGLPNRQRAREVEGQLRSVFNKMKVRPAYRAKPKPFRKQNQLKLAI